MISEVLDVMQRPGRRGHDDGRGHPRDGLRPHGRQPGGVHGRRPDRRGDHPRGVLHPPASATAPRTSSARSSPTDAARVHSRRRDSRRVSPHCCGQETSLGSSGASAPPVVTAVGFPEGRRRPSSPRRAPSGSAPSSTSPASASRASTSTGGFDVEIAKIISAKLGLPDDKIAYTETPSKFARRDRHRPGRLHRRHLHHQRRAQAEGLVRRSVLHRRPGPPGQVDDTAITGPESLKGANARVCSVSGSTPAKEITKYVDQANIVLFDVYSKCVDALRNGQVDAVTTDNVILSGLRQHQPGRVQAGRQAVHQGDLRHRHRQGRHGVLPVHQRHAEGLRRRRQLLRRVEGHRGHRAARGAAAAARRRV